MIISSCNKPDEVLSQKKMERLMYDIYIAESLIENDYSYLDSPEKKEAFINQIFEKHKVTEAQWDTSLSWYSDRIDIYIKMNDSVKAQLQRRQQEIDKIVAQQYMFEQNRYKAKLPASYIPESVKFGVYSGEQGFSFRLDLAEVSERTDKDNFNFNFTVLGLSPDANVDIKSMLILEYKDTILYKNTIVEENNTYTIPVSRFITNDTLNHLSGYIRLLNNNNKTTDVQVFNISLGEKKDSIEVDIDQEEPNMNRRRLTLDSIQ